MQTKYREYGDYGPWIAGVGILGVCIFLALYSYGALDIKTTLWCATLSACTVLAGIELIVIDPVTVLWCFECEGCGKKYQLKKNRINLDERVRRDTEGLPCWTCNCGKTTVLEAD